MTKPAKNLLSSVSFVMPVLNEERYLANAVESILQQQYSGEFEVILALGPSTDGTNKIAAELAEKHKNDHHVVLVQNPSGTTSAGLNAAIKASNHDVIVRVDAHSKLAPTYTAQAVEILNETGAANVGGLMRAVGHTPFQSAVAWGYMNRIGLGGGAFHVGADAGPADSVYLGVFRRTALIASGGFDEKIIRGQDWELNLRLRQAGEVVWFDPRLEVEYHPRSSWPRLAKQFFDTGLWRGQLTRKSVRTSSPRYFAPPVLLKISLLSLVLGLIGEATGSATLKLAWLALLGYFGIIALAAVTARPKSTAKYQVGTRLAVLLVLPTMHYFWGAGFIAGFLARSISSKK